MKKRDLLNLAMMGVGAGLLLGACQTNQNPSKPNTAAAEQMNPESDAFHKSLSADAQKKFDQLDAQHKAMAVEMTHATCKGKNSCKGQGGCKTSSHSCAGQNDCKGQGGDGVKDPNKAVDVQYNNQTKQRNQTGGKVSTTATPTTEAIL